MIHQLQNLVDTLSSTVDQLKLGQMQAMHQEGSLIMQKFMSEGIVTAVGSVNVRNDAYSDLAMQMVDHGEITKLLSSLNEIALSSNGNDQALADEATITLVVGNISTNLETALIRSIATHQSIIVYRKITNALKTGLPVGIPSLGLQTHTYAGEDITITELTNLTYALEAFGLTNIDTSSVHSGTSNLVDVQAALAANSYIIDRIISEAVTTAGLDTVESHVGMENPLIDIQREELENLFDAFIAFGISDIDNAQSTDLFVIYVNAQAMNETEFNSYIGFLEPYDPLTEDLGLTIFKDFLIGKLDNQILNPSDLPNNFTVSNRQELHDLIFP